MRRLRLSAVFVLAAACDISIKYFFVLFASSQISVGAFLPVSDGCEMATRSNSLQSLMNCRQRASVLAFRSLLFRCSDLTRVVAVTANAGLSMMASRI